MKAAVSYESNHETAYSYCNALLTDLIDKCNTIAKEHCIDITTNSGELGGIYRTLTLKYGVMSKLVSMKEIDLEIKSLKQIEKILQRIENQLNS